MRYGEKLRRGNLLLWDWRRCAIFELKPVGFLFIKQPRLCCARTKQKTRPYSIERTDRWSSHVIVPVSLRTRFSSHFHFFNVVKFMPAHACPPCAPSVLFVSIRSADFRWFEIFVGSTYQGLGGAVQSVTVVAAELGVDTLQGRVTVGLRLLDTARKIMVSDCVSM